MLTYTNLTNDVAAHSDRPLTLRLSACRLENFKVEGKAFQRVQRLDIASEEFIKKVEKISKHPKKVGLQINVVIPGAPDYLQRESGALLSRVLQDMRTGHRLAEITPMQDFDPKTGMVAATTLVMSEH